jgi:hypothetical protein
MTFVNIVLTLSQKSCLTSGELTLKSTIMGLIKLYMTDRPKHWGNYGIRRYRNHLNIRVLLTMKPI